MERRSVKKRIFISNALMVSVTLVTFLMINVLVIKIYSEIIETELRTSVAQGIDGDGLDDWLKDWTVRRNGFLLLFGADGLVCILVLVLISQIFTKNLTSHIMEPLNVLAEGAARIKDNDLTQDVVYAGDAEFENVCSAFNDMRESLLQEQEKIRKYEKARTDMIAGISHDLRTPLTAVRGTIKGLIDGVAVSEKQRERFLEAAYRRTGDMDMLLNKLFDLSKIETGNIPLSLQTIDISAFIRNYADTKREFAERDGEEITVAADDVGAQVSADPVQLIRILDNLLENSRKYADQLPLKIKISLKTKASGVCICFSDNGAGVPEEKLPHIFEEFYRGDESRNKTKGNGLGLYIVKYLIEAMGGTVSAESENGLRIYMELPLAEGKEAGEDGGQEKDSDCRG